MFYWNYVDGGRWHGSFWILSASCSNWPSQPINFLLGSQTPSPQTGPVMSFWRRRHGRGEEVSDSHCREFFTIPPCEAGGKMHTFGVLVNCSLPWGNFLQVYPCFNFSPLGHQWKPRLVCKVILKVSCRDLKKIRNLISWCLRLLWSDSFLLFPTTSTLLQQCLTLESKTL